jgi:hypothetical protein
LAPDAEVALVGTQHDRRAAVGFQCHASSWQRKADTQILLEGIAGRYATTVAPYMAENSPSSTSQGSGVFRRYPGPDLFRLQASASLEDYLGDLPRSRRSLVRRDQRDFATSRLRGIETTQVDTILASDLCERIWQIKVRHGLHEPIALLRMRVERWLEAVPNATAWLVEDYRGALVAGSIGCSTSSTLFVYEVGVDWSAPACHCAYIHAMIYMPMSTAGVRTDVRVDLGYDARQPKVLRGASSVPTLHLVSHSSSGD